MFDLLYTDADRSSILGFVDYNDFDTNCPSWSEKMKYLTKRGVSFAGTSVAEIDWTDKPLRDLNWSVVKHLNQLTHLRLNETIHEAGQRKKALWDDDVRRMKINEKRKKNEENEKRDNAYYGD